MNQKNNTAPSIALPFTISIIVISFAAIFVKWSTAPPTILGMYRMYIACILLLPVLWMKRGEFRKISSKNWLLLIFAGMFLGIHFALWFKSLELTTVASSTIILALQPMVALAGVFLIYKERTSLSTVLIIGVSFIGVVLVGWGDIGVSRSAIIGDLLSFLCVIAVVCYLLIGQNAVKQISHWVYSFCVFLFAGLTLTIFNLIAGVSMVGYPAREWGIFILLAIFPTVAHLIYNWLLNYVDSTTISMSILGEPVGATILAAILLGERVTGWQFVGGGLVLVGVFIFLMRQRKAMVDSG